MIQAPASWGCFLTATGEFLEHAGLFFGGEAAHGGDEGGGGVVVVAEQAAHGFAEVVGHLLDVVDAG